LSVKRREHQNNGEQLNQDPQYWRTSVNHEEPKNSFQALMIVHLRVLRG
jgi:hypothetical protein